MFLLTNLVDTIGLFYICFFFIIMGLIFKNSTFQVYAKNFYKNYSIFFNFLPLMNYVNFFFNNFIKSSSVLVNKFFLFFKKK
jgi:hypothetical protein